MSKKVLILSGSPRKGGNSDLLCDEFMRGAKEAGNEVEKIRVVEPVCIHIAHAQAAVEGIDHARGRRMRGDRIQLIRHIAAVQRRAVDLLVVVHQELAWETGGNPR